MQNRRRRGDVTILEFNQIEVMATENGFLVRPAGHGDVTEYRAITTLVELVEVLTEWAYAMHGDFPVMNVQSPHAPAATRAALDVLARRHTGRPPMPGAAIGGAPEVVPPGNLSGTGRRVHPGVAVGEDRV